MTYDVIVLVPSPALGGQMRQIAKRTHPARTLQEVREFARTNREMWRCCLSQEESRFLVLAVIDHVRPVLCLEHTKEWGTDPIEHSRDTLRSMLSAIQPDTHERSIANT